MKNWAEKEVELACKHAAKTPRKEEDIQEKYENVALKINDNVRKDIQNNLADIFVDSMQKDVQNLQKNLSECDFISNTAGTIRLFKNKK